MNISLSAWSKITSLPGWKRTSCRQSSEPMEPQPPVTMTVRPAIDSPIAVYGAVRQLAATPKFIYVLGFSPDTAVAKSGFHKLEVKLRDGRKLNVQARAGYYDAGAPQVQEKAT